MNASARWLRGERRREHPAIGKRFPQDCGGEGARTPCLVIANDALYQMSYTPKKLRRQRRHKVAQFKIVKGRASRRVLQFRELLLLVRYVITAEHFGVRVDDQLAAVPMSLPLGDQFAVNA